MTGNSPEYVDGRAIDATLSKDGSVLLSLDLGGKPTERVPLTRSEAEAVHRALGRVLSTGVNDD